MCVLLFCALDLAAQTEWKTKDDAYLTKWSAFNAEPCAACDSSQALSRQPAAFVEKVPVGSASPLPARTCFRLRAFARHRIERAYQ